MSTEPQTQPTALELLRQAVDVVGAADNMLHNFEAVADKPELRRKTLDDLMAWGAEVHALLAREGIAPTDPVVRQQA